MATKMGDFKEIINQSVSCFDDSALEVLSCIADDRSNCDLIVKRFGGKLAVRYYIVDPQKEGSFARIHA